MSFIDRIKKAGKGVVDAGAKTMLKVRGMRGVWHVCICRYCCWRQSPKNNRREPCNSLCATYKSVLFVLLVGI